MKSCQILEGFLGIRSKSNERVSVYHHGMVSPSLHHMHHGDVANGDDITKKYPQIDLIARSGGLRRSNLNLDNLKHSQVIR